MLNQPLNRVRFGYRNMDIECITKAIGDNENRKKTAKTFTDAYLNVLPFFDALDSKKISSCMLAVPGEEASDSFFPNPFNPDAITFVVELKDEETKLPVATIASMPGENPLAFLQKTIIKGTEMFFSKMGLQAASTEKSCSGGGGCKGSGKCGGGTKSGGC